MSADQTIVKTGNCIDCQKHRVLADRDPDDWFCDDDVKVICGLNGRAVTVACRPYNTRKECKTPTWCPLPSEGAQR